MGTTRYGTRLSIKKSQVDSIGGGGSSVDNESFRADQVYMNMVNKSGGTLVKGTVVTQEGTSATAVQGADSDVTLRRSRIYLGVVLEDAADDATVKVCYGGKAQVLLKSGEDVVSGDYIEVGSSTGLAIKGSSYDVFATSLEDLDLTGGGAANTLLWVSLGIGEIN
tara:strand:- start:170 stop:667 length:498 start_codon:yes stop_codon:yes gene_type:complete